MKQHAGSHDSGQENASIAPAAAENRANAVSDQASPVVSSTNVAALLRETPLDGVDARILLCHASGWRRTELITRSGETLTSAQEARFRELEQRRLQGEPVAQLVGEREFFGRRFLVTPAVLIPRPDTELLVDLALQFMDTTGNASCRVLDMGTGSGAIAVTLAAERPAAHVTATDFSTTALDVAKSNAAALLAQSPVRHGGAVTFLQGSWFDALHGAGEHDQIDGISKSPPQFDLIVSNPPYIAGTDPHLEQGDLRFEPRSALTDGADGLNDLRAIIGQASQWLADGAALMVEHGYDQGAAVRALFEQAGFTDIATRQDLGAQERVTLGIKSTPPA